MMLVTKWNNESAFIRGASLGSNACCTHGQVVVRDV